ncbi:MAG: response regulator transcription factor [Bacteroidia bacterium]|nr:response regulator transcription factor [Bacteroidia bacterium]
MKIANYFHKLFAILLVLLYNCVLMSIKLKACIVDDESLAISSLKIDLSKNCHQVDVIATFQNPKDFTEFIKQNQIDILFLDIEMPEQSGILMLEQLGNFQFDVVFITAYTEYALKAIKIHAYDYLLKPIDTEELKKTVNELCLKRTSLIKNNIHRIALADINGLEIIDIDKIIYCLADKNYTTFFLTDNRKIVVSRNIGEYAKLLNHSKFFRIHQSSIVNLFHVTKITKGTNGSVIMSNGTELKISRANKNDFFESIQKITLM